MTRPLPDGALTVEGSYPARPETDRWRMHICRIIGLAIDNFGWHPRYIALSTLVASKALGSYKSRFSPFNGETECVDYAHDL